jgi:hypothetical protein
VRRRLITRQDLCVCKRILVALFGLFRCPAMQILTSNECLLLFFLSLSLPAKQTMFYYSLLMSESGSFFLFLIAQERTTNVRTCISLPFFGCRNRCHDNLFFGLVSDKFFFLLSWKKKLKTNKNKFGYQFF